MNTIFNKVTATMVAVLALTACSSSGGSGGSTGVDVVASTNVYGDIVRAVAGRSAASSVHVTSIITSPDQDPHSFEANAGTALAISHAKLVIENGGGYDDFVGTLLRAHATADVTVLDAVRISGKHVGADFNEHVWYDFPTVVRVTERIVSSLARLVPSHASTFRANGAAFVNRLHGLERTEASIRTKHRGAGVAITEPVPLYLLQACGLVNRTPTQFSEAIESGTGVSVRVLQQTEDLLRAKRVAMLAYNEQTTGPETTAVLDVARASGVAVVPVTETLPQNRTYLQWMSGNLAAVSTALAA